MPRYTFVRVVSGLALLGLFAPATGRAEPVTAEPVLAGPSASGPHARDPGTGPAGPGTAPSRGEPAQTGSLFAPDDSIPQVYRFERIGGPEG